MQRQSSFGSFVLVLIALAGFGVVVWLNSRPTPELRVIVPTPAQPTAEVNAWESILRAGFGDDSTPLPTVAIPTGQFIPPTLEFSGQIDITPLAAAAISDITDVPFSVGATPTPAAVAAQTTPLATLIPVTQQYVTLPPQQWRPPPLVPPISRDPLGRDHYWFIRPVDSNANNRGLFYYPYGSDGAENNYRIHAGIDMPNSIGETVRAAGSGKVVWAADGLRVQGSSFQNTSSYGNVVVIQHDFGFRGRPLYTLYAHLSAVLVVPGQIVNAGDAIGLVGNTGRVTGPHVHFEVRIGTEDMLATGEIPGYGETYNPVFWMVPYVNTGVIAGRVTDRNGNLIMDAEITIREWARGLVTDTTTTYIYRNTPVDVNPDPVWGENFAVGDVPAGRYDVIVNVGGERLIKRADVVEGTTTFLELSFAELDAPRSNGS